MDIKKIIVADIPVDEKLQQIDQFYLDELITKREASILLEVAPISIDRYLKEGHLVPFINKERNILFKKSEVKRFKSVVIANKIKFSKKDKDTKK
ncbi:hypothetical protein [Listeria booriae]|uniref:hypothetical protein n=1 Tax=Listeria booriae TaxID=1552123 RepID=UPI001E316E0D|nr:hypothetical protein [Listeria booriae]MCD2208573.1 hypothetical protein [Listeria booriae]